MSQSTSLLSSDWGRVGYLTTDQTTALAELWLHILTFISTQPSDTPVHSFLLKSKHRNSSGSLNQSIKKQLSLSAEELQSTTSLSSSNDKIRGLVATYADIRKEFWFICQDQPPDAFLLRFLRARKFDVPKAYSMALNALNWRFKSNMTDLIALGEINIDALQFSSGKAYFHQEDRLGRPVIYINARHHIKNALPEEMLKRHTVFVMETGRIILQPLQETVTIVFNLANCGLTNMDIDMAKFLVNCLQNFYPESLGMCLIINAPWVFSSVWKLIKPWLDPVVEAKIVFAKPTDLQKYIDPAKLPCEVYESKKVDQNKCSSFVFEYIPPSQDAVEAHKQKLSDQTKRLELEQAYMTAASQIESLTKDWALAWLKQHNPTFLESINLDSPLPSPTEDGVDLTQIMNTRDQLCKTNLAPAWWDLDNYLRFDTVYHRIGLVQRSKCGADWSKYAT